MLRVDPRNGAGLELLPCSQGFLVQVVDATPNQYSLSVGDIIVAIGITMLFGLQEEEVEENFRASFEDGAILIVGRADGLLGATPEALLQAIGAFAGVWQGEVNACRARLKLFPSDIGPEQRATNQTVQGDKLMQLKLKLRDLQDTLAEVAQGLSSKATDAIDARLSARQQAFISWLAAPETGPCPDLNAEAWGLQSSVALQRFLALLSLTPHLPTVAAWCETQGAISLTELIEHRADVAHALIWTLSARERAQLFSDKALSAAELASLQSQISILATILDTVYMVLAEETVHPTLTPIAPSLLLWPSTRQGQCVRTCGRRMQAVHHGKENEHVNGEVYQLLEKWGDRGTPAWQRIHLRDQELNGEAAAD